MVTAAYARMMTDYNAEMNRRFFAAAGRLSDAARRQEASVSICSADACSSFLAGLCRTCRELASVRRWRLVDEDGEI